MHFPQVIHYLIFISHLNVVITYFHKFSWEFKPCRLALFLFLNDAIYLYSFYLSSLSPSLSLNPTHFLTASKGTLLRTKGAGLPSASPRPRNSSTVSKATTNLIKGDFQVQVQDILCVTCTACSDVSLT